MRSPCAICLACLFGLLLSWPAHAAATSRARSKTDAETVPIGNLLWQTDESATAWQVRGVITKTGSPVYLQDRTGGIELVGQGGSPALRLGDEVEASGPVLAGRYSAAMRVQRLRVLRVRVPDPPLSVTATMAASGEYDKQLVEISGILTSVTGSDGALTLWLSSAKQLYAASMKTGALPLEERSLRIGSTLKVTGICVMDVTASAIPVPFHIVLRSPKDVEVLSGPSFWTRTHVLFLFTTFGLLVMAALIGATRIERWRLSLILEERTRLAHDLHDSLAQSFAGIAFQLHAIRLALRKPNGTGSLNEHVDLAISMVSHSHEDARRSIAMLKPADDTEGNLLESLLDQAQRLTQGGTLHVTITTVGDESALPPDTKQTLLRIGHEAITNAVRHANPTSINLQVSYSDNEVCLIISDNGSGFLPSEKRTPGFGLLGIQSRAAALGGKLFVRSAPGHGCEIEVSLPISRKLRPWPFAAALRKFSRVKAVSLP